VLVDLACAQKLQAGLGSFARALAFSLEKGFRVAFGGEKLTSADFTGAYVPFQIISYCLLFVFQN
jgi:hypothetical protein